MDTRAVLMYQSEPVHSMQGFLNVCLPNCCPEWAAGIFLGQQQQQQQRRARISVYFSRVHPQGVVCY